MTDSVDVDLALHKHQLEKVNGLITKVAANLAVSVSKATILWYACHFFALVSAVSGVSIVGTSISGTKLGEWVTTLLGFLAALYSLLKYVNLEERRAEHQSSVKFYNNLKDRLEEVSDRMQGILDHGGVIGDQEREKWAEFVVFINATKKIIQALDIGIEDIQNDLKAFHEAESRLQRDAAGFPLPASPALERGEDGSLMRRTPRLIASKGDGDEILLPVPAEEPLPGRTPRTVSKTEGDGPTRRTPKTTPKSEASADHE